nr:MAG TPA: hypothetical protein [Caudoviricetes sp.]
MKWSKTRELYQSYATRIHNVKKSPDFQTNSTFKPVRLWQRDADWHTMSAASSGSEDMIPRTAPDGQNVPFGCIFR